MTSERISSSAISLLAALVLSGCAGQLAVVSEKPPARFQTTSGTDQSIAQTIDRAQELERAHPLEALAAYASAARDALRELDRRPADAGTRRCYNFAVAG